MADEVGDLVLLIGDLHIPHRAQGLPEQFKEILVPDKMRYVLATGNLCTKDQVMELRQLAPHVTAVRGEYDEDCSLPEKATVRVGDFEIGVCHGHQVIPWGDPEALATLQREMGVDILVTGGTHSNSIVEYENKYFINPGSATGAFASTGQQTFPSFVLLVIRGSHAVCYVYELHGDKLNISKSEFSKSDSN